MRWYWEWSDLIFLCRRTFKKVKLFFFNAKKREEGFHFWLDNFPYYIINVGYITIFYLLRLALTPYLDTWTIFRVYAALLIFYWYGLSIQDDSAWFAHFWSYILTFFIFLILLKFFSIYTAVGLILMFRPLAINLSLMTIILGSIGTRKILTFFRFLWERFVKNKNDN